MPRPANANDVLALVRRSGLVPEERLNRFRSLLRESGLDGARPGGTAVAVEPATILALLVEQGLLTRYQAAELAAGRTNFTIGPFRILDLLGRGGMGHVYLAEHPLLGKRVALKVLNSGDHTDEAACERFVREARAAAALDDPNIVRVFDVNVNHDPPYLVMEYVDGVSLQAAVARYGTFPPGEAAAVALQVLAGLQSIADAGLTHRDIKPANILIDRKGGVKILDLGIARFQSDPISKLSDAQSIVGTLDYLAPEQAIDSSLVDVRADLYGLGGTLFFLLAGHPPFADDDVNRKLVRKRESNPPSIAALRLDLPPGFAEAIDTLLARSACERFRTPREAAEALKPFAAAGPDFPARLFKPWKSTDVPGPPTRTGEDPSPTLLPPTRRILRSSTERSVAPPQSMPDTTPMPAARFLPPVESVPDFLQETELFEMGSPTVTLTAPVPPKWWRNLGRRFWLAAAALVVFALFAALLGRSVFM